MRFASESAATVRPEASTRRAGDRWTIVVALAVLATGCTTIRPAPLAGGSVIVRRPFSHEELLPVLRDFVDERGFVNYAGLAAEPMGLNRYYFLLSKYSPDNDRSLFPTERDRLAYWINAYNASVLKAVIAHEPIDSVRDVRPPFLLSFLPEEAGFFVFQRVTLGRRRVSLYSLENRILRRRFGDPRVHFAINCASVGCSRLRRAPYTAVDLEVQLDEAAREFVADERNVRIDHDERVLYLSSIFDWFRKDFTRWLATRLPQHEPTLAYYVALYSSPERRGELERAASYEVRFLPYDWRLNRQPARPRPE